MQSQSRAFLGGAITQLLDTTTFAMIEKVVYIKPKVDALSFGLATAKYEYDVGDRPASLSEIYAYFSQQPWKGKAAQLRHVSGWTHRTGFDIDLKQILRPVKASWIAIAINFDASSNGDSDFSFLSKDGDSKCIPIYAAVTVGTKVAPPELSWIAEDKFGDGLDIDTLGVAVRRTAVFACQVKTSTKHGSIPFNLGVAMNSNPVSEWAMPLIIDPEIKNDG